MTTAVHEGPARVAIVGGGISGLATALAVKDRAARAKRDVEVVVLEKAARAGGNLRTERIDGYACEWGPNGFLDSVPETLALVRRVGIEDRLQPSDDAARRRFLYHKGVLHPLPPGIGAFLRSGLLSLGGKLRLMGEPFVPARRRPAEDDESIRSFAARRVGAEAADVMIDSLVSGIFAGDPSRLSLRACFPKMYKMETQHGGLVKAMIAGMFAKRRGEGLSSMPPVPATNPSAVAPDTSPSGSGGASAASEASAPAKSGGGMGMPAGKLTSFCGGIQDLVDGIAGALGSSVRTGVEVVSVARRPEEGRWICTLAGGERLPADAVVLSSPSPVSARIVSSLDPTLAAMLEAIEYASVAVVCLGFDPSALPHPLDGFGFLVPRGEGVRSLGVLWDSSIYPGRAPAGKALLRAMIGGARDPEAVQLDDAALMDTVLADLARTMGRFGKPELVRIFRHPRGIPQYTLGHLERMARMETVLQSHPGLFLTGNAYYGVAINSCIAGANPLAETIGDYLATERSGPVRSSMNV